MKNYIVYFLLIFISFTGFSIDYTLASNKIPEPIHIFHHDPVHSYSIVVSAEFSTNGDLLATCGSGGVKLWNVNTGKLIHIFNIYYTECIVFSCNEKVLFAGTEGGTVYILDIVNGKTINSFKAHDDVQFGSDDWGSHVWSMDISPDGMSLFSYGVDNIGKIWDTQTYKLQNEIENISKGGNVKSIFLDNNNVLVGTKIWNLNDKENTLTFDNFGYETDITTDMKSLYSFNTSIGIFEWNINSSKIDRVIPVLENDYYFSIDLSEDNSKVIIGSNNSTICYDIISDTRLFKLYTDTYLSANPVRFSPDGTKFITGGPDATVYLWDLNDLLTSQSKTNNYQDYK